MTCKHFATLLLAVFLFSCSDNSTELDPNCSLENAMMLKVGNYWVYNTIELDQNGNAIAGTEGIDSSYVSGMKEIGGKKAYEVVSVIKSLGGDSLRQNRTCYSVEGSRIMELYSSPETVWAVLADCSKKQWTSVDATIKLYSYWVIEQDGTPVETSAQVIEKLNGATIENEQIRVIDSTINSFIFQITGKSFFQLLTPNQATWALTGTREMTVDNNRKLWLAPGIGLVKLESSKYINTTQEYMVGIRKNLSRYPVK